MARRPPPDHARVTDFRDVEIMYRIAEETNGVGVTSGTIADILGFEEGNARPVGIRLAWMRRYGMVAFDEGDRTWKLTTGGERVVDVRLRAPQLRVVDSLPDEASIEVMAHMTARLRFDSMLGRMLRREFLYSNAQSKR